MHRRQAYCIDSAHGQLVRDLDFNPNRQYYLSSCGDDCLAKFWDIRNVTEPVNVLSDHSHWCVIAFSSENFCLRFFCDKDVTVYCLMVWE